MELRPADLGPDRAIALLRLRGTAHVQNGGVRHRGRLIRALSSEGASTQKSRSLGLLGRYWTRGTGMDEATATEAVAAIGPVAGGFAGGFGGGSLGFLMPAIIASTNGQLGFGMVMATAWAAFVGVGLTIPGVLLRKWYRDPIAAGEIEALLGQVDDDTLERAYLTLLRDVLRHEQVPEEAAGDIRAAIRSLGEAIDRLPPLATASMAADVETLRRDVTEARARAAAEPDPVIAASLERRAEALERSAQAAGRSSLLLRRTAALREELAAQTEALRLGLAAFYTGATDIADLAHLSEAVRGVAAEAASVADARAEVDSVSTWTPQGVVGPQPLRVGAGR